MQTFNLDNALKIVDNDYELLQEIVQLFKSEKISMLKAIENSLEQENLESIKFSAHSLKGTLSNLGADICTDLALQIEHTETADKIAHSVELFASLKLEVENFLVEVDEKLKAVNQ